MNEKVKEEKAYTCDDEETKYLTLIEELEEKYKAKNQEKAWLNEKDSWKYVIRYLIADKDGIQFNYRITSVLDIGGAGAVFKVIDCNLYKDLDDDNPVGREEKRRRAYRALKVPRPHTDKGFKLADSLRSEISKLTSLNHPNIITIYAKGQIPITIHSTETTWPWFIMDYLDNATDLQKYCKESTPNLPVLIRYFYDIAKGLKYIHDNKLVHCDVKPGNIFLPQTQDKRFQNQAILADFGYAKHLDQATEATTIGFTEYYAHPLLKGGAKVTSQKSRSFNEISRFSITPKFDMFSLGVSINDLLGRYYFRHHIYKKYTYEMKYLGFCAARLLDGYNHITEMTFANLPYYSYKDKGKPNADNYIKGLKYINIGEFVKDISKLIGEYTPEIEIPELVDTRRENIQVSDSAPVVYTERLRKIVDLPVFRRLSSVTQLGLLSLVYPGGSHTRLEHSLGTFGVTAKYITSLYNDTLSPIFKQLSTAKQIKKTLLAALLHDIGQYPLAHDLEDISSDFFSHEKFGKLLLDANYKEQLIVSKSESTIHKMAKDLNDVLKNDWGVTLNDVKRIMDAKSSEDARKKQFGSHVDRLCKSLIDGPIDADKIDYLERDSRHCNVTYGFGIDRERLFKCLTVACQSIGENNLLIVMGVHEKGRISAESLLFARYAMLTQVYWHHTMRCIKALLHFAACEILANASSAEWEQLRNSFFECAILEKNQSGEDWHNIRRESKTAANIHPGDLRILSWLWKNTTPFGKNAIECILNRKIFKRVLTLYGEDLSKTTQSKILSKIFSPDFFGERIRLRQNIETAMRRQLMRKNLSEKYLMTMGFTKEEWEKRNEKPMLLCLVDYPAQRVGADFGLKVVRQWGERPIESDQDEVHSIFKYPKIIQLDYFKDGMKELEKSIACLRVFWTPEEYRILKENLKDDEIKEIVLRVIDRF